MAWGSGTAWGVFGALLALVAGCSGGAVEERGAVAAWQVERSAGANGAALAVRLDRDLITTAEWLTLEVEVQAAEGKAVRLPAAAELEAGSLRVERMLTEPPELVEEGTVRWLRRFELQPFLAGDYTVPALQVAVAGAPAAGGEAGGETRLTTEPIPVTVVSVIDPAEAAPRPREVQDPVAVAPRTTHVVLLAAVGLAVAGTGASAAFWWRRRAARIRAREALVPPHEVALRALRELADGDLPERDPLAFHHAVADWLDDAQRRALHAFLARCDRVKFAGSRPPAAVARALIDTAADLVTALCAVSAQDSAEEAAVAV